MEDKLSALITLTVKEYESGMVDIKRTRMDMSTRKLHPEHVIQLAQDPKTPLTHDELLLLGAAERVAQTLGYQPELPW